MSEVIDVTVGGATYRALVQDDHTMVEVYRGDEHLWTAVVRADGDALRLDPHRWIWRGNRRVDVAPHPALVECVAAAIRERAPAWGPPRLWADGDWRHVFRVALETAPAGVEGYAGSTATFGIADVAEVIATANGENDGASWVGAFRLRDGRFAFVEASCDYTGWG
jgi:hypothetical protein